MKILFITSYYPPAGPGWGYMQLCEEVADRLAARGHQISVLTSDRRDGQEASRPYPVHRLLTIDPAWDCGRSAARQFFFGRLKRERTAVSHLNLIVREFHPQVIFVWHAIGLPRVLLRAAEQLPNVVVAYYLAGYLPELADEYISYWHLVPKQRLQRLLKWPLRHLALAQLRCEGKPITLRYNNAMCVSNYVRQRLVTKELLPESATVVHNGIDISSFSSASIDWDSGKGVSLLYAGRLEPDKGVHRIVEALGYLSANTIDRLREVQIVGDGHEDYKRHLAGLAESLRCGNLITFVEPVPREKMPMLLSQFNILMMPSELEALARIVQEAMAVGLLVIGTNTGGSGELLEHEKTGLVFETTSARSLARQLDRAILNPNWAAQLAAAGQARVRESFRIDQTIDQVEAYLQGLVQGGQ